MGISRGNITTNIIKSGLVFNMDAANRACYPRTGTTATDTIGNTSGTLNGATFSNINSGVFNFDGTDDYIGCADTTYLNGVSQMSLSVWFNFDNAISTRGLIGDMQSVNYNSVNGHFHIITKDASGSDYSFRIYFIGTDSIQHSINIDNRPFTAGQWHNLVMTYNAGTVNFYVDGSLAPSTIHAGAPIPTSFVTLTNNKPLEIGRWSSVEWDGKIANSQIYNRALSANEVLHNYNALKSRFE